MQNDNETTPRESTLQSADSLAHTFQIARLKKLLAQIVQETRQVWDVIMAVSEREEMQNAVDEYETKVQMMLVQTKVHMELYRESGWKELIYGEENE